MRNEEKRIFDEIPTCFKNWKNADQSTREFNNVVNSFLKKLFQTISHGYLNVEMFNKIWIEKIQKENWQK